jgi:hypothetical protein
VVVGYSALWANFNWALEDIVRAAVTPRDQSAPLPLGVILAGVIKVK